MILASVSRRYAKALFEIAEEKNLIEIISKQFKTFYTVWEQSKQLRQYMLTPLITTKEKKTIIEKISTTAGLNDIMTKFLIHIAEKERFASLQLIYLTFQTMVDRKRGILRGEITSAFEVDEDQLLELTKTIEAKTGKKVILSKKIQPELIGGIILRIGDKIIDGSLKGYLDRLKSSFQ